jgi:chromate transporter
VALAGFMHRDLVERRGWVSLTLAQVMPGPLAAQLAVAIGYFQAGILGATLSGLAFVLPSFILVLGISNLYMAYGGLWWVQALFYTVGPAVIAIMAAAACRLARATNKRDPLLWAIYALLAAVTVWARAELAEFFVAAGVLVALIRARPGPQRGLALGLSGALTGLGIRLVEVWSGRLGAEGGGVLLEILIFFAKAGAFVFGSGLAIVPFLYQGAVERFGWLNERQFLDAVAVGMVTPGPVVVSAVFIGFLAAGFAGAVLAGVGVFLPMYLLTVIPAPWFRRHRESKVLKAFVDGATAAATGAISGAVVVLGLQTVRDPVTAAVGLLSLGLLWRFRLPEPAVVVGAGILGLAVWPLAAG